MNHRTLDSLLLQNRENSRPMANNKKSFSLLKRLQEVKMLLLIFVILFFGMLVFTNANLFFHTLWLAQQDFDGQSLIVVEQLTDIQKIQRSINSNFINEDITSLQIEKNPIADDLQAVLEQRLSSYGFDFNMLPPVDRLVINSISLDVPLISVLNKSEWDFVNGDFDDELRDGVVKYPTTPRPGEWGNTMIFGHTSQERREKNPYGTVFSHLPRLQYGDEIQLVREWELYRYKVVETVVRRPRDVDAEFQKRQAKEKEYITLMGCYPLGTTRQRMMVMAERIY